jgi:hypothetical protein
LRWLLEADAAVDLLAQLLLVDHPDGAGISLMAVLVREATLTSMGLRLTLCGGALRRVTVRASLKR